MVYLEWLLWAYFIINPLYIYFTYEKTKEMVLANRSRRLALYWMTIIHLWLPVSLLLLLYTQSSISLSDIGLQWRWDLISITSVIAMVVVTGYGLLSLKSLGKTTKDHAIIREQFTYVQWLMPHTEKECRLFLVGVAVTAGICEELLFRGYLMHVLSANLPTYLVVIISSLAFGLPHIYQGTVHVFKTAIFGGVMALTYLATDSIIVPIILHVLADMYSGTLAYIVFSKKTLKQSVIPI